MGRVCWEQRREENLTHFFHRLRSAVMEGRIERLNYRMARQHHQEHLARRTLLGWRRIASALGKARVMYVSMLSMLCCVAVAVAVGVWWHGNKACACGWGEVRFFLVVVMRLTHLCV